MYLHWQPLRAIWPKPDLCELADIEDETEEVTERTRSSISVMDGESGPAASLESLKSGSLLLDLAFFWMEFVLHTSVKTFHKVSIWETDWYFTDTAIFQKYPKIEILYYYFSESLSDIVTLHSELCG